MIGRIDPEHAGEGAVLRLDRPPPEGAFAMFPPSFGRRFVVMVDAEEEFDWSAPFSRAATATTAMAALPEATRRFDAAGVVPTYLADYPIVDTPSSAALLAELVQDDLCDVGAQLHPWVTPPHEEEVTARNSFVGSLPRTLEAAKIAALTARIEAATGVRPTVYRAGRYGVGANTAEILRAHGYRLDVSVRALFDYSDEGGPDFAGAPVRPWWAAPDLLELPSSSVLTGALRGLRRLPPGRTLRGVLARTRLLERIAMTPEGVPLADALAGLKVLLDDGVPIISLSYHTPSLVPGHTPYVRDAADLRRFWAWWDGMFDALAKAGVTPVRPAEIVAAAAAGLPAAGAGQ